jgi:hypothetical protein
MAAVVMAKIGSSRSGSIATRVARHLDRLLDQKVIDLSAIREGRDIAEKLQDTSPGRDVLDELHPAHAAYTHVLNQVSILAETLSQPDEVDRISNVVNRAEDEYVPDGPPMSPLTRSFFNSWTFFDCGVGIERETFGTIILALRERLRMHAEFVSLLTKWQTSRMGLFELEESTGATVGLRELVTGAHIEAVNPTGYKGDVGTIWYVRALPPPVAGFVQHVIVTTPYEITAPGAPGWTTFLERTLPKTKIPDARRAYEHLMKWGLSSTYWSEYLFEAYVNHDADGIRLMGLPDVPESRPHSRMNEDDNGPLRSYLASGRMATGAPA